MSIRVPRLDWCRQESTMPAMMNRNITLPSIVSAMARSFSTAPLRPDRIPGRFTRPLKRSMTMGRNSM